MLDKNWVAGFKGVSMPILLLIATPLLVLAFSEIVALWGVITVILLLVSPVVTGLLGFIGDLMSKISVKHVERPEHAEGLPPSPPPSSSLK